jgi:hypothetical protein
MAARGDISIRLRSGPFGALFFHLLLRQALRAAITGGLAPVHLTRA